MLSLLLACAPSVPLSEVEVASADLDGVVLGTAAFIGGGARGRATLSITDTDGNHHSVPVTLRAGTMGAVLEANRTVDFGNAGALELPDAPLTADQLLGSYRGTGASFVVVAGVKGMNLENPHGVVLDKEFFTVGFGIFAGVEWLGISLGDDYGESYDWDDFIVVNPAWDTGSRPDSGDTGVDTGAPIDTGGAIDTGPPSPADTGSTPEPQDSARCDGCDGDGACGCGSGALWALPLLFPWIRLRRTT